MLGYGKAFGLYAASSAPAIPLILMVGRSRRAR